jgi:hypothetical protein
MMRYILLVLSVTALITLLPACDGGREGDRCNPNLSHNDCNDGLLCTTPSSCAESYCCPSDPSKSSNPYCNGKGCPAPATTTPEADAGSD